MAKEKGRDLTVGVTAALGLVALALVVMSVGDGLRFFRPRMTYEVNFESSNGLIVGSPVKIAGVQVGTVESIRLATDSELLGIQVTLGVQKKFSSRVRKDSMAALRMLQFVSGEKYVEIITGSPDEEELEEGGLISRLPEEELLQQGADIAENLSQITFSLKEILEPIVSGEGLLGELISDPDFGKDGLARLKGSLSNLEALTGQIEQGKGFVGRALYDREFAGRIDQLGHAIEQFSVLADRINSEDGAVAPLLESDGPLAKTMEDLQASAAALRRLTDSLERETGLLGRLLQDEEWSEGLAADVRATMHNLSSISAKIDSGQGTLGALINERSLHEGLEQVLAGVGDSKFAKWMLRHYLKNGVKLSTKERKTMEELLKQQP
jgi:phospholipid/cholesterol/gamma-HCH transport system substrate-binding protein